jgi:hypothetical protein
MVAKTLNRDPSVIAQVPRNRPGVVPGIIARITYCLGVYCEDKG